MARLIMTNDISGIEAEYICTCTGAAWIRAYQATESLAKFVIETERSKPLMLSQLLGGILLHNWQEPGKIEAYLDNKVMAVVEVIVDGTETCDREHDVPFETIAALLPPE